MAEQTQLQENNISQFNKGLFTDYSYVDQPNGTYRFALNAINESERGDAGFLSNEGGNKILTAITPGHIIIGDCYLGNNETAILSVSSDETVSEIGILKGDGTYQVHVNDALSIEKEKLGFKISRQIQATYRLRRGCERTIYFVGKGYKPRYYNFDKPAQFKKGGLWAASKFTLFKSIEVTPTLDSVEVLDNTGNLLPGSYSVLVQHLDEDLNGTSFQELVTNINIYNDQLNKTYSDIEGSSHWGDEENPYKYPNTNKAIKITMDIVDKNFTYVRFAFVERTSGTGQVSSVKYSDIVSVNNPTYTYTGDNAATNGTIEEVELFNMGAGIDSAEHIEQIDNMLMLSNIMGSQADICKLQKYASKIKTDCFVKDILLTTVTEKHNPKNPLVHYNGVGYQPKDIYSLGIVWVFDDHSVSPVCHIPGKSPDVPNNIVYSPETGVYPMSNNNNQNSSETYLDENSSCSDNNFWGIDSEGATLKGKKVRHHRFPSRDEIGIGFVKRTNSTGGIVNYKSIVLNFLEMPDVNAENYTIQVRYTKNGVQESFSDLIIPNSPSSIGTLQSNIFLASDNISNIKLIYIDTNNVETELVLSGGQTSVQANGAQYKVHTQDITENNSSHIYEVPIFGLKFSNIELPPEEEIGKKVIGYQIVRQERTETDKNVLDSAVVFPMMKSGQNVSTAMLAPQFWTQNAHGAESHCEGATENIFPTCFNISKNNIMLVSPLHKFSNKTHDGFTNISEVGKYTREYFAIDGLSMQNVMDGGSATGGEDNATDDSDGFSMQHIARYTSVKYEPSTSNKFYATNENARMYNLNAVNYAQSEGGTETLYNIAADNTALVLSSSKPGVDLRTYRPNKYEFPYVYIEKNSSSFYQNFRSNPYYYASTEIFTGNTCKVFGGDTYISPLRYSNQIFGNVAGAIRRKKVSVWLYIATAVIAAIGVVLAIFSAGTSLALVGVAGGILIAAGAIVNFAAAMVEIKKFNEIYQDKWQANLDRTVYDYPYAMAFVRTNPAITLSHNYSSDPHYQPWYDDTFRWWGEVVGDLWFESTLNFSLRVPPMNSENNYLRPLKPPMDNNFVNFNKLTETDYTSNNTVGNGNFRAYKDISVDSSSPILQHFKNKIIRADQSRSVGYVYQPIPEPQIYFVNSDFDIRTSIKKFYTIPVEYDCCSECRECFPHRVHYSQQSFQEEKSDNYRMFLPNNYRDIEGETGKITNTFRLHNNFFVHTEEALWQMGRNYQERVTDNIVSFIGTGSYFEIPPQKILDDETGMSAGSRHKWGTIKTPEGVFFVSENSRKIYQMSSQGLNPISNIGISKWFKNNLKILQDESFRKEFGYEYPYANNPSNISGTGFISTYDSLNERILFTKKDLKLRDLVNTEDSYYCINGNTVTLFTNMSQIILAQAEAGWVYQGIENCRMKFKKTTTSGSVEVIENQVWVPPVYETVTIPGGALLHSVCTSGVCQEPSGCDIQISVEDVNGNIYTNTDNFVHGYFWELCLYPEAFVDDDMHTFLINGLAGGYQADFEYIPERTEQVLVTEGYWDTEIIEIPVTETTEEFNYIDGTDIDLASLIDYNASWTISYSLKNKTWTSWHSYQPNYYIHIPEKYFSYNFGDSNIWEHNVIGEYQTYYGEFYPHIIEYVSVKNPLLTKITNTIQLQTEAKTFNTVEKEYHDERYITFNKAVVYNSRQCSGEMNLIVKDQELSGEDYLMNQVINTNNNNSIIDRTERDWFINDFRDIRIDYSKPIWNSDISAIQSEYFIDKILNTSTMDINKDWTELESFRDKYLVVRLIFDKFANKKLITNFSIENEQQSFH